MGTRVTQRCSTWLVAGELETNILYDLLFARCLSSKKIHANIKDSRKNMIHHCTNLPLPVLHSPKGFVQNNSLGVQMHFICSGSIRVLGNIKWVIGSRVFGFTS